MSRLHLVELEDLPWFPAVIRDGGTAYLELVERASGHAAMLVPKLAEALEATGSDSIVDLCSGGGGPVGVAVRELAARGRPVRAHLTDFYPNARSLEHAAAGSNGQITWERTPVDATAVPPHLTGFRTIFNAFHHFPPDMAKRILADAMHADRPIALFELVSREPAPLLGLLLTAPLAVLLTVPFWRPFRFAWLFWTWILPVLPFFVLWDGVVSCLRVYSEDELRALVADLKAPGWTWEIGRIKLGSAPVAATYLIGRPGTAQSKGAAAPGAAQPGSTQPNGAAAPGTAQPGAPAPA